MDTTTLTRPGRRTEVEDPHAVPYPSGPVWDRLGHELVYGREPETVAREYGEDPAEVERLSALFWDGYGRSVWLAEAEEHGLLDELVRLPNDELLARLDGERRERAKRIGWAVYDLFEARFDPADPTGAIKEGDLLSSLPFTREEVVAALRAGSVGASSSHATVCDGAVSLPGSAGHEFRRVLHNPTGLIFVAFDEAGHDHLAQAVTRELGKARPV